MKSIVFLLLFFGVIFTVIGYTRTKYNIQNKFTTIEYRYIPRNIYIDQLESHDIYKQFSDMFNKDNILT